MTSPLLSACRLRLSRGRRHVYDDLTLDFFPGVTALLGPNGAGKTTLLDALASSRHLGGGTILLDGHAVDSARARRLYSARIGHMPQNWRFFAGFTARESVEYVAWLKDVPSESISSASRDVLERVGLGGEARMRVSRMSGGMRQRVGLAEALVNSPRVVLLDEPTVGLDPAQRASFRRLMRENAEGRAVIMSTHLTDDVEAVADRVIVVDAGRVLFDGTVADLLAHAAEEDSASALESAYIAIVSAAGRKRAS